MDRCLLNLPYMRRLLRTASKKASWWDLLWADPFMKLVRRTKEQYRDDFRGLYDSYYGRGLPLSYLLKQGYVFCLRTLIFEHMDFSTAGRTTSCLAFLAFVIDDWCDREEFSFDYILDSVAVPIWQVSRYREIVSGGPHDNQTLERQ